MSDKAQIHMQLRSALAPANEGTNEVQRAEAVHDPRAQLRQNAAFMAQMKVQRKANGAGEEDTQATLAAAAQGVQGSGGALPYLETIQKSFGHHDVSGVQAFVGGQAKTASEAIGAEAYASGNAVAFRESPTLHTAAHEAAHIALRRAAAGRRGPGGRQVRGARRRGGRSGGARQGCVGSAGRVHRPVGRRRAAQGGAAMKRVIGGHLAQKMDELSNEERLYWRGVMRNFGL